MTQAEDARIKRLESDVTKLKQAANIMTKQITILAAQNEKFKNTIHQQKLDIETLKRKP